MSNKSKPGVEAAPAAPAAPAVTPALQALFQDCLADMDKALIERTEEIKAALTALLCNENILLVGPPGVAKSLLADSLCSWLSGKRFSALLNKFSTPEELFGPYSVTGLASDRYERVTAGYLPEAEVAFLDEIFKSSTAILNTLLTLLNERVFRCGAAVKKTPLKMVIAASNEWPQGEELSALFDRFLFRLTVHPVRTAAGLDRLMWADDLVPALTGAITPAQLEQARREALGLKDAWTPEAKAGFEQIRSELFNQHGIAVSPRRLRKARFAVQAYAYVCGAAAVEADHLEILQHILWDVPEEQPIKVAEVVMKVANPTGMKVNQFLLEAEQLVATIDWSNGMAQALTTSGPVLAKMREIRKALAVMDKSKPAVVKALAYIDRLGKETQLKVNSIEL